MATRVQFRRGLAANWTSANPTLAQGEMGIELDTDQFKIGDGIAAWNDLGYGGLQGPQGTSINVIGSVENEADLPASANQNDAFIVQSNGDLYIWDVITNLWDNVGQIVGPEGPQGPQGPQGATGASGPQGIQGETGAQGIQGEVGPQGPTGTTGAAGSDGDSAYEIAVANGFVGTETQWLDSLQVAVESGTVFPESPIVGKMFLRTDQNAAYIYGGNSWLLLTNNLIDGGDA